MRFMIRSLVLTSAALCATAAFAADKAVVNVPFNFEAHGKTFQAGQYSVSLDHSQSVLTLRNTNDAKESIAWTAGPGESSPSSPAARLKFDGSGNMHALHSVQLGARVTPVLDAPAKRHDAGSLVDAVSGQ